jgi:hypothetical protein
MPDPIDLNPDGPHSPDHTAELSQLFDDCSRAIVYATMSDKHGLEYPSDVYTLVADLYSATGRLPQVCEQVAQFLHTQAATGHLYEAQGRGVGHQVAEANRHLSDVMVAAQAVTRFLQAVQADISGLGVKETDLDD